MADQGFDKLPQGFLIKQNVSLCQSMGVAYERGIGFYKNYHWHDRSMIVLPVGSTRMRVHLNKSNIFFDLTSRHAFFLPKGIVHDDLALTTLYDTLAIFPSDTLLWEVCKNVGLSLKMKEDLKRQCFKVDRSKWLDEIVMKYHEEHISRKADTRTKLLETQLLDEIIRLIFPAKPPCRKQTKMTISSTRKAEQALAYIESHLFEELELAHICEQLSCSESTLIRNFKKNFSMTPKQYIISRRLDEARHLIRGGNYEVGDISSIVGYEDFSAFSRAFKAKFSVSPSSMLEKTK